MSEFLRRTMGLRDEAWQAVMATPEYKAYKALDDAVRTMEGVDVAHVNLTPDVRPRHRVIARKLVRITNGDVAARVLRAHGEPLPVGRWLEKTLEGGAKIAGDDPLPNFRSTVSRDNRFYSFMRNNMYFWWLNGVELPEGWEGTAEPDLLDSTAAPLKDQEGGDANAAATT